MATYTERYVDAAMRAVPDDQRPDLAAEIRATIDDEIEGRMAGGDTREHAEREVLTNLGDPERLAARYTDRTLALIGPSVYLDWLRVLKVGLLVVVPVAALLAAIVRIAVGSEIGEIVAGTVLVALFAAANVLFWVTFVFAALERTGRGVPGSWTPESLPRQSDRGSGAGDGVGLVVFVLAFAGAVAWDGMYGFAGFEGEARSILVQGFWPVWAVLLAVLAVEIAFYVALYRTRGWTAGLALVNSVLAVAVAGTLIALVATGSVLNDAFFEAAAPGNAEGVQGWTAIVAGVVIALTALWDVIDGWVRARKATA